MRIISGIYKGRKLKSPETDNVRPTSDRAKETLFNILNNRIDFEGITVLDLFCGTGSLGLESISRGTAMCYFVDEDVRLVQKNVELLKIKDKTEIIKAEVLSSLERFHHINADLVFCDPPYDYKEYSTLLETISSMETLLILEHSGKFDLDVNFEKYVFLKKKIGTVNFTLFDFTQ
jgi:16S rRNA (guanine(966)-N(2))-methyltransferase RsmD